MELESFLASLPPDRRAEAERFLALFAEATGFGPALWPGGIIGFGAYDYRYDSGHSGTSPAAGFAPRKAETVVYLPPGTPGFAEALEGLGPVRAGKSCLYIKRFDRLEREALVALIRGALAALGQRWTIRPLAKLDNSPRL